jgi:hypothetical protein
MAPKDALDSPRVNPGELQPQSGKHPTSSTLSHRGRASKPLRNALWFSKRPPCYQLLYAPAKLRVAVIRTVTKKMREHGTIHNFTTLGFYSFELFCASTAQKIRSKKGIPLNLQSLTLQL